MAYTRNTWTDGEDTIVASKLNNMEAGIAANADAIDELNTNLGALKQLSFNMSAGTTYRLLWGEGNVTSPRCVMFIAVRGANGSAYANLLVNGYGYSTSRTEVTSISKGSSVTYEVESDNYAMTLSVKNADCNVTCTLLLGTLPTVSLVS